MYRPLQPQFKLRVQEGKRVKADTLKGSKAVVDSNGGYVDVETCTAYPVTYEVQSEFLSTLNFTIDKDADLLLYYFYIGQTVTLYGGDYSDEAPLRHVFTGTVTRIRTSFSDNGHVAFTVECMSYGFTKLGKDPRNYVYPDTESNRKFATEETLTLRQIIEGIAKERGYQIGEIDLSTEARSINFDAINICCQRNETDWKFLTKLARDFGCTVWISTEDGEDKLNFMSYSKALQRQSQDIGFVFPLYGVINTKEGGEIRDSEVQRYTDPAYNRPRILRSVQVDEDISQAYAVSRSAVYFDKETGESKETISRITEKDGKKQIVFYELDESRVEYIHRTDPKLADEIRNNGPTSMEWGEPGSNNPRHASFYYREKVIYDEQTAVFDKAFFGLTVTAKCNQDLDIRTHRTYRVRGILRYHSKDAETSLFLRGLKHVWDSDGTWTELTFMR